MNVHLRLICWLFLCPVMSLDLLAEDEEDSTRHTIRVQVLLVESNGNLDQDQRRQLSGPSDQVMKAIKAFTADGRATIVNQAELTLLEEQPAILQVGETVPLRSGTTRTGSGRESKVYNNASIGTLIKLNTRVVDEHVLVEFNFEKSFVTPRGGDDDPEQLDGISQLSHQSTLRIKNGHAQLTGSMSSRPSGNESRADQLIVTTQILDSFELGQSTRFQSFTRPSGTPATGGRSSNGAFSRPSSEEVRRRFATSRFDRADANDDGVITDSELASLAPRDLKAKPPITKQQYEAWIISEWHSSSSNRPNSIQPQPRRQRIETEVKRNEKKEESGAEGDEPDEPNHDKTGNTRIEVAPDLGTVIIRGTKRDVQRVVGVITQIEETHDEDERAGNDDTSSD